MLIAHSWVTRLLRNNHWDVSDQELDAGFVRVGFETEGFDPIEETTGPLVIGRVDRIEELTGFKKPIRFCHLDVGTANDSGEPQEIICGARNFAEGDLVVVALPGAVLPHGFAISARKTYDHISNGMICSAAELGLAEKQNSGIITLPGDAGEPGDDARPVLGLHDTVFDVNITPDRGYALSARGLAREISSAFGLEFIDPAADPRSVVPELGEWAPASTDEPAHEVNVDPSSGARRFGLRRVTGVDPAAQSPFWLQRELMLCGQRPVNAATDVTNYVMLLLGTPMHAFDAAKIQGPLTVRRAQRGETLETLDHVERKLDPEDVVISDEVGIQSLAGVMGGTTSEVSDSTTDVFFEAAIWDPIAIARTSRRHKLSSEASRRFERGVDPTVIEVALDLACSLLTSIAGGDAAPSRTLIGEVGDRASIRIPATYPGAIAGVEHSPETVAARLREVGCEVSGTEELDVVPPTWRPDLTMKADLVEEVLRLEGLEAIPSVVPTPPAGRGLTPAQRRRRAIGHALAYSGYAEILPTPFIANDVFDVWGLPADDFRRATVKVQNPLEADHAQLGTTLLPAMLEAVKRNDARGQADLALYGVEQVSFAHGDQVSPMPSVAARPTDEEVRSVLESLPKQPLHVATVGVGQIELAGPWGEGRAYTYADAIESARVVARAAGVDAALEFRSAEVLPWHPGRCAEIVVAGAVVGHAGELHPQVLERAGLPVRTCAMEIDVSALPFHEVLPAPVLSSYPALMQDVALVVDESTAAEAVRRTVQEGAGELVEDVSLFDVYRSESIGEGKKSLAFAIRFRAPDRTLTEDECSEARLATVRLAGERHAAELRG